MHEYMIYAITEGLENWHQIFENRSGVSLVCKRSKHIIDYEVIAIHMEPHFGAPSLDNLIEFAEIEAIDHSL